MERGPVEAEPKFRRDPVGLSIGVRDDATGEVAWVPFKSLRDAMLRLAVVRREYVPGLPNKMK